MKMNITTDRISKALVDLKKYNSTLMYLAEDLMAEQYDYWTCEQELENYGAWYYTCIGLAEILGYDYEKQAQEFVDYIEDTQFSLTHQEYQKLATLIAYCIVSK